MRTFALHALFLMLTVLAACNSEHQNTDLKGKFKYPIEQGFALVDGGKISYEESGVGVPIVLIHGVSGDKRHWDNQFGYLASDFRVIRYDVRGFGNSSLPKGEVPYSDHADLVALLDHLQIEEAHIVGWSMGSGIAFDFASAYPARTKSVISVGPWVNGHLSPLIKEFYERMAVVGDAATEGGAEAATAAFMDLILGDTIRQESAGKFFELIALEYSWWAFMNDSPKQSLVPTAASALERLPVPTYVITAEYDLKECHEMGELIITSVPGARQTVMSDTGHMMHIEKSREFNALVADFLRSEM